MPRYLIEVPHADTKEACDQAIEAFLRSGSHFVTNADWGCSDGVHKTWFIAELDSKEAALLLLPPLFRQNASVTSLEKFGLQDMEEAAESHGK
jgi:hypothetical protein